MSETAETVADVLRKAGPETWKLQEVADPIEDVDRPDMTYEDWVRPMKLTGGRVCLRVETARHPTYLEWHPDGLREWTPDLNNTPGGLEVVHEGGQPAYSCKKVIDSATWADLTVPGYVLALQADHGFTPVLRAETPFGEADDG